jgi:hypothetical protein
MKVIGIQSSSNFDRARAVLTNRFKEKRWKIIMKKILLFNKGNSNRSPNKKVYKI